MQFGSQQLVVAREILVYLTEHPDAQDTVEGIVEWWMLEREIKHWSQDVQKALAELVALDVVLERKESDGHIHYRINKRKQREIRALLAQQPEAGQAEPLPVNP